MAHRRLLKAEYNPETHESIATVSSQYGVFTHTVVCDESDYDIENRFDGIVIAENKCYRDIAAAKAQDYRIRLKEAKHIYNVLCAQSDSAFSEDSFIKENMEVVDALRKQVAIAQREYDAAKAQLLSFDLWIADRAKNYAEVRRELREKAALLHPEEN